MNRPGIGDVWLAVDVRSFAWRHVKRGLRALSADLRGLRVPAHQIVAMELPRAVNVAKNLMYRDGQFPVRMLSAWNVRTGRMGFRLDVLAKDHVAQSK